MTRVPALPHVRLGGAAWLTAGELCNRAARFLLLVLIARTFGPEPYGRWVLAAATGMILTSGGDLGLATVIARRIARDPGSARRYVSVIAALAPVLLLGAALSMLVLASTPAAGLLGASLLLPLGVAGMLESGAFLMLAPLRAVGRLRAESALRAAQGLASLTAFGVLLAFGARSIAQLAYVVPAIAGLSFVVAFLSTTAQFGWPAPRLDLRRLPDLLRESLPVAAAAVTVLAYVRIDAFLLAWLRDERAVGLYGAAYTAAFGLTFVPAMFQRAHLPVFAAIADARGLRREVVARARTSAVCAAAAACFLLVLLPLLVRIYGRNFEGMEAPYALLVIGQTLIFFTTLGYTVLLAKGRTGLVWALTLARLVVNVAANIVLIPTFGVGGAALAAVAGEITLLTMQAIAMRHIIAADAEPASVPAGATEQALTPHAA